MIVKNKYNTENSSSNKIREGTEIKKWYRLDYKTKSGVKYPVYQWDELNDIFLSDETLQKEHEKLFKNVSLIVETSKKHKELEELNKELTELNK